MSLLSRLPADPAGSDDPPLRIVLVGGSASAGAGLPSPRANFAWQVKRWLERLFPLARVSLANAAIGATASDYYAHCLSAHLPRGKPGRQEEDG